MLRGKWLMVVGAVLALAMVGGGLAVYRRSAQRNPVRAAAASPPGPALFGGTEATLTGVIVAPKTVSVAASIDGIIDAFFAEPGQEVTQGQLLARIRNARLDSELEASGAEVERVKARVENADAAILAARLEQSRASADLARAKSDFERLDKVFRRQELLLKEGATPRLVYEKAQREWETARKDLETKQALADQADSRLESLNKDRDAARRALDEKNLALDHAKADVSAGELLSPVAGVIAARKGQPGEEVSPTMTDLFQIAVDTGSLQVTLTPEPPVLARMHSGQQAVVRVAEYPESLPASVREIRGGQVIVEFASPSMVIKPGVTASVGIVLR